MFFRLVYTLCSLANPGDCKDYENIFEGSVPLPVMCVHFGSVELAKILESKPGYTIKKYSCKPVSIEAAI